MLDGLGAFSRTIKAKAGQCPCHRGDVAAQRILGASALKLRLQLIQLTSGNGRDAELYIQHHLIV